MPHRPYYEPGTYWGRIVHHQLGEAKTGTVQLIITFVVLGRVNPEDPDGDLLSVPSQQERTVYRAITENTIDIVKEDLRLVGCDPDALGSLTDLDERNGICNFRGQELAFQCRHEEDPDGVLWERWSIARERGPLDAKQPDQATIKRLDALFGFGKRNGKRNGGRKPALSPTLERQIAEAQAAPDDVPF